jgi:hypothetical protein
MIRNSFLPADKIRVVFNGVPLERFMVPGLYQPLVDGDR